jgi:hypothetical protein
MDPESLEEFKEQQAKISKAQNAMVTGDFRTGYVAILLSIWQYCLTQCPQIVGATGW